MKICITSQGTTLDARVDPRFGRAAYFLLVEPESMDVEVLENRALDGGGGMGTQAAKLVIDAGARAVLTGSCGPNAFRALQAAGVQVFTGIAGSVRRAAEDFKAGRLTPDSQAASDAHNG
jgi:predicted Fe-Mo cluster-binding NifX family protein